METSDNTNTSTLFAMDTVRRNIGTPSGMSAVSAVSAMSLKTTGSKITVLSDGDSLDTATTYNDDENYDDRRSAASEDDEDEDNEASEQTERTCDSRDMRTLIQRASASVGAAISAPVLRTFVETDESRREIEQTLQTLDEVEATTKHLARTKLGTSSAVSLAKAIARQIHTDPDGSRTGVEVGGDNKEEEEDYPFMRDLENVSDGDGGNDGNNTRNTSQASNKRSRTRSSGVPKTSTASRRSGETNVKSRGERGGGGGGGKKSRRGTAISDNNGESADSEYAPSVSLAVSVTHNYATSAKDLFREFCDTVFLANTIGAKTHLTGLVVGWLAAPGNTFEIHTDSVARTKVAVGTVKRYTTMWFTTAERNPLCLKTLYHIIHRRVDTSINRGLPGPLSSEYHIRRASEMPETGQFISVRHSAAEIAHKYTIADVHAVDQLMGYFDTVVLHLAKIYAGHVSTPHELVNFGTQLARIRTWNVSLY